MIDEIGIVCFKKDLHLARACLGSVRYWYPDRKVVLYKDVSSGVFDTSEMERHFGVESRAIRGPFVGWGLSKLQILVSEPRRRLLLLDSDTVLLGRVVEAIDDPAFDFVVTGVQYGPESEVFRRDYVNVDRVGAIYPGYRFPGYGINSGQMIATTTVLDEKVFLPFVELDAGGAATPKYSDILPYADQGILNLVLTQVALAGEVAVAYKDFWLWSEVPAFKDDFSLETLRHGEETPAVVHWAGTKSRYVGKMTRSDVLFFFEDRYYDGVPGGHLKKKLRQWRREVGAHAKDLTRPLRQALKKAR